MFVQVIVQNKVFVVQRTKIFTKTILQTVPLYRRGNQVLGMKPCRALPGHEMNTDPGPEHVLSVF